MNDEKSYLEPKYKLDPPKMGEDQSLHLTLLRPEMYKIFCQLFIWLDHHTVVRFSSNTQLVQRRVCWSVLQWIGLFFKQ